MFSNVYRSPELFEEILRKQESFNNPRPASLIGRTWSNTGNANDIS